MRTLLLFLLLPVAAFSAAKIDTIRCGEYISYGKLIDGKREGEWKYVDTFARQLQFTGSYKQGLKTGTWKFYDSYYGGPTPYRTIEVHYKKNQLHGEVRYYLQNTLYVSGHYTNGLIDGEWRYYSQYDLTILIAVKNYSKGKPAGNWMEAEADPILKGWKGPMSEYGREGHWTQFEGDSVIGGGNYVHGRKEGYWKEYVKFRQEEGNYAGGKKTGRWIIRNGTSREAVYYQEGLRQGPDSLWDKTTLIGLSSYCADTLCGPFKEFYRDNQLAVSGAMVPNTNGIKPVFPAAPPEPVVIPDLVQIDLVENGFCSYNYYTWFTRPFTPADRDSLLGIMKTAPAIVRPTAFTAYYADSAPAARTGHWMFYYRNGRLHEEGDYLPEVKIVTSWDSTNQMEDPNNPRTFLLVPIRFDHVDYVRTGWWKFYDEQGILLREERYEKGELKEVKQH